ncbi:response regulator [Hyalangium rubrum]|uniref:Response regulator n=1 Tax=Hyalangium rubrum TaxID=3103134 RepID=A0ABU5HFX3_9BACT|nr:response regulator [Hyalangium sp. s54d21]MDY7232369.1 response regulator [Hyalangium sp. s54d21]
MASLLSGPILVVEDDPDIREALQGFLELQGYEVRVASHGREAVEHLTRGPRPALILLDMGLPIMDGHRLLTFRKQTDGFSEIPVVILSAGMAAMHPRDRALYASNYNVAAFIKKPADLQTLVEAVERHALRPLGTSAGAPA